MSDAEVADIRESLSPGESLDREYTVELVDAEGVVHAEVEKTLYVRQNRPRGSGPVVARPVSERLFHLDT